ncbi:hypothetical protein N8J89_22215 [Crossiella sp. CA-258035]|uniref:hypothetical protein n=1 Tax=Crossiella sp. CA-258035 TaxID=2981138 RepID=UPI0024BD43D8|nr:hypothetical protein [Crossiella sp. CA-258035]WHT15849.1 hypothetical protein N8J89_22215 [Crossiella sp. CA-258035]
MTAQTSTATAANTHGLLRLALRLDAVASGGMGLLLLLGSSFLTELLGLPAGLLLGAGAVLVVFAAGVATVGMRQRLSRVGAWEIVVINALWVIASLAVAATVSMTGLGLAFVLVQAAAVAVFAELQVVGLRRAAR